MNIVIIKEIRQLKNAIISTTSFVALSLIFSSCSDAIDPQFCKCIEAAEEMDAKTSRFIGGGVSEEEWLEVKELSQVMASTCQDYTTISAEEELLLREQCENH